MVIYEENHSFDNLHGRRGPVDDDTINGVDQAGGQLRGVLTTDP